MKIKILTIEDCTRCEKIKTFLKESGTKFTECPCESNTKTCDEAETITSSMIYPMVILENEYTGKKEFIYTETKYESMRPHVVLSENITLIPRDSIDSILTWVKKRLN